MNQTAKPTPKLKAENSDEIKSDEPVKQKPAIEADVLQAQISVSLAQKRRLVSSWLPPPTPEETASEKKRQEAARLEEDQQLVHPLLPSLGLDCPIPQSYQTQTANLRGTSFITPRQALANRFKTKNREGQSAVANGRPQTNHTNHRRTEADSDDEEEQGGGRSSLGKSAKNTGKRRRLETQVAVPTENQSSGLKTATSPPAPIGFQNNDDSPLSSPTSPSFFSNPHNTQDTENIPSTSSKGAKRSKAHKKKK